MLYKLLILTTIICFGQLGFAPIEIIANGGFKKFNTAQVDSLKQASAQNLKKIN